MKSGLKLTSLLILGLAVVFLAVDILVSLVANVSLTDKVIGTVIAYVMIVGLVGLWWLIRRYRHLTAQATCFDIPEKAGDGPICQRFRIKIAGKRSWRPMAVCGQDEDQVQRRFFNHILPKLSLDCRSMVIGEIADH